MDMDKGDLDWEKVENALAGTKKISLFAGAGDSLFGIAELGDDSKVVTAKGNLTRREEESLANTPDGKDHCMHTLELGPIGIGDARAARAVEGAIVGIATRREAVL